MKTRTYEGVQHGDWVRCVLCGAQMLLPCGADKCPECSSEGTLMWIDEDFNPKGIRIGFWNGGDDFKSAHWWDYQDCYITISHCDCDDNSLFSDRIKNSIEPELWISLDVITNYLPDIKQNHLSQ